MSAAVNLELGHWFLERLAARDPEAEHVVIWDRAGFHLQAYLHALPARVYVIALPPYSPEYGYPNQLFQRNVLKVQKKRFYPAR